MPIGLLCLAFIRCLGILTGVWTGPLRPDYVFMILTEL